MGRFPPAHFSISAFDSVHAVCGFAGRHGGSLSLIRHSAFQLLPEWLDVGVDADDDGFAVDTGFGFLVAVAAGDGERLAGGGRTRRVQRDFDVEDVVLDGGFHGWLEFVSFQG